MPPPTKSEEGLCRTFSSSTRSHSVRTPHPDLHAMETACFPQDARPRHDLASAAQGEREPFFKRDGRGDNDRARPHNRALRR